MDLKMEVYTPNLELIGFLEIQRSVIWEEKAFSAGSFSVESLITDESLALLQPENIIWIEGETAGIIEYIQEEARPDVPYIAVKGCTLAGILRRRILWGLYSLKGTAPEIMHYLVNDCAVNPTRGNAEARKIPNLVLMDPPAGGDTIIFQKTGGTLLEALEQLGETYGVAFGVRFNPAVPQMEFWTRWGQNRSVHQTTNEPVFYSTELDDVLSSEYSYNSQDYRNVSLVAGEGEGNERVYVTVENEAESSDVPVPPTPPTPPEPVKYTITLLVDPEGGGVASGGKTVAAGVSVTVTATPSDGFAFVGWQENGAVVSTDRAYTFTVNGDRTLTAVFAAIIPVYTITVAIDPAGSGTVTGAGEYKEGETVTLRAEPADGMVFSKWQIDGQDVGTNASYTFVVANDAELVAVFGEASRLPAGYTEVEYIHIYNKNCYFSTNLKMNYATTIISVDMKVESYGGSGSEYLLNCQSPSVSNTIAIMRTAENEISFRQYGSTSVQRIQKDITGERIIVEYNGPNKKMLVGDSEISIDTADKISTYNILTPNSNSPKAYLYGVKITTGEVLEADLIPCTTPSGDSGFYDIVRNSFFAISGSNDFSAGPAV